MSNAQDIFANNPALMNALQGRINDLIGKSSGYIESLPKNVLNRVHALENLQTEQYALEAKFREEVLELEKKYLALYAPLYEKRTKVVSGAYEPTEEECKKVKKDDETEDEDEEKPAEVPEDPSIKGIPEFWLTALKNHPTIAEMITENDEEALRHLTDITVAYLDNNPGFMLTFHFSENEFFTNAALTKTYYLQNSAESVYGDLIYDRAEGCEIAWKDKKDLSVIYETKKQRHKATNKTRVVTKTVPTDTFFNFFKPPAQPTGEESEEVTPEDLHDLEELLEMDYEIGENIKEKIIPRAVGWFTGEALEFEQDEGDFEGEDEFDYDDEEDLDDDEDDEDDDDEDDDDDEGVTTGAASGAAGQQPPECKQQ